MICLVVELWAESQIVNCFRVRFVYEQVLTTTLDAPERFAQRVQKVLDEPHLVGFLYLREGVNHVAKVAIDLLEEFF